MTEWITSLLDGRPDLIEKSIPNYPAAGKRMLQDNGSWLNCLKRPDVDLVRTAIDRVVPDGIVTVDGTFYPADVICYATGFRHNEFLAPMAIFGRDGISLREQWGDEPSRPTSASRSRISRTSSASTGPGRTWPTGPACSFIPSAR